MGTYTVERSTVVEAPADRLHGLVADLRQWTLWSPWEGLDPDLERTYTGPDAGVGARYAWSGNRKAGSGSMEVVEDRAEQVDLDVEFLKPFRSQSRSSFVLAPRGPATEVTWRMTGEQSGLMGVLGKVVPMDKLIGKDFEKGLARLKAVAEHTS